MQILRLGMLRSASVRLAWLALGSLVVFIGDQGLKYIVARNHIAVGSNEVSIAHWHNAYGSFSIHISSLIIACVAGAVLFLWIFLSRSLFARFGGLPLVLILGGGASNVYDRVTLGGVMDIWHVHNLSFNGADVAVVAGTAILICRLIAQWCELPNSDHLH